MKKLTKKIENIQNGEAVLDEKGNLVAIKVQGGKEYPISDWEHKTLARFEGVVFRLPQANGKFLRFIEPEISIFRNGSIATISPYWRYGVKVGNVLVTRTYRAIQGTTLKTPLPFGREVVGRVEITRSKNSLTGEERILVNHYLYEDQTPREKEYQVKIGGTIREGTVFRTRIPGTPEYVVVNKL